MANFSSIFSPTKYLYKIIIWRCFLRFVFQGAVRAPGAVHLAGAAEPDAAASDASGADEARAAVQGEPQERVQASSRLQLHHPDAGGGGERVSAGGDPRGRRHRAAHHLVRRDRNPRLRRRQRAHPLHQLLHHRLVPDQLRHLLRHVAPVPADLQGAVRARRRVRVRLGVGRQRRAHARRAHVRAHRLAQKRRQLQVLAGERAPHRLHQRDRALDSSKKYISRRCTSALLKNVRFYQKKKW